jgi:hypothetical protein
MPTSNVTFEFQVYCLALLILKFLNVFMLMSNYQKVSSNFRKLPAIIISSADPGIRGEQILTTFLLAGDGEPVTPEFVLSHSRLSSSPAVTATLLVWYTLSVGGALLTATRGPTPCTPGYAYECRGGPQLPAEPRQAGGLGPLDPPLNDILL